jgi:hypothetical protein
VATLENDVTTYEGHVVVGELDRCSFQLHPFDRDMAYAIKVGDIPISQILSNEEDANGTPLMDRLVWRDYAYFESARGITDVEISEHTSGTRHGLLTFSVVVIPTKVGEVAYETMAGELESLSRGLLTDLFGKSKRSSDIRFARDSRVIRSREEELDSISRVVGELSLLLQDIRLSPAYRLDKEHVVSSYWGATRLGHRAIRSIATKGVSLEFATRPFSIVDKRVRESFDIPPHRAIKAFLALLEKRATLCGRAAIGHIAAIVAEQPLRELKVGKQPSLYESVDVPRMQRLRDAADRVEHVLRQLSALKRMPFLQGVKLDTSEVSNRSFWINGPYKRLLSVIRSYLLSNGVLYEGDAFTTVSKLTSRLFEQWNFLRIVDAFRGAGLQMEGWQEQFGDLSESRYTVDFDRGMTFEGRIDSDRLVRFRYEPWILDEESARRTRDSLCRASSEAISWSPDIVIECLRLSGGLWEPEYVIVMDSKYTRTIRKNHWADTTKYLQIRSTSTHAQVVKQLWLISVDERSSISSEDPMVEFLEYGPSCSPEESNLYSMKANPRDGSQSDIFARFAEGTMRYLRERLEVH